jgi:hypothetical protein
VSISTVILSFFICPFNLRVRGWVMHVMATSDILGVLSSMSSEVSFWKFVISSFIDSIESDSSSFSASQVYNFFELSSIWHLCLGSHFLHFVYIFLLLSFGTLNFFFYLHVDWVVCIFHQWDWIYKQFEFPCNIDILEIVGTCCYRTVCPWM